MGKIGCRPESYWGVFHLQALVFEPAHSVHCSLGAAVNSKLTVIRQ
jgi:hypothetical protein